MASIQDLLDAINAKDQQTKILAQPSVTDNADVDPSGTAAIQHAQNATQGINLGSSAAMGTIAPVGGSLPEAAAAGASDPAAAATQSFADRIKAAAQNSPVKVQPSQYDTELAKYAQDAANRPQFGEPQPNAPASIKTPAEVNTQNYQIGLRNQAQAERAAAQEQARRDIQFQQLLQNFKNK